MRHHAIQRPYDDVVMGMRPVLYVPMQAGTGRELVRMVAASTDTAGRSTGPFPGAAARRTTASTGDDDRVAFTSNASYHPGDTFSIAGWFFRRGAGDTSPSMFHNGTGDFTVYFPAGNGASLHDANT